MFNGSSNEKSFTYGKAIQLKIIRNVATWRNFLIARLLCVYTKQKIYLMISIYYAEYKAMVYGKGNL